MAHLKVTLVVLGSVAIAWTVVYVAKKWILTVPTAGLSRKDQALIDRAKTYMKLCGHRQEFERFRIYDLEWHPWVDSSHIQPNYGVEAHGKIDNRLVYVRLSKTSLSLVGLGDGSDLPHQSMEHAKQPYAFDTEEKAQSLALSYAQKLFPNWRLRAETRQYWTGAREGVRRRGTAKFAIRRLVGDHEFIQGAADIHINTRDGTCSDIVVFPLPRITAPPVVKVTKSEAFKAAKILHDARVSQLGWWAPHVEETARLTYVFEVEVDASIETSRIEKYYVDAESGRLLRREFVGRTHSVTDFSY
ncbi:MAG: hypothetical protein JNM34_08485 [Chthonomonadaceae bacterium]|nr:hypothetical protein [Chthonomonadaceae bacterium]